MPELLNDLADTPEMRRLSGVGMHCGCEYTDIPIYKGESYPYSRLMHSKGVSWIIWHFTKDIRQAVAGLLHDIATPVFAHTIDFMNDDHVTQESTEEKTLSFIVNSVPIMALLHKHDIRLDDVCDYHKYPIADNDTPMLSADRLEYTLGNGHDVFGVEISKIREMYDDLTIAINEYGDQEMCFRSVDIAKAFSKMALKNSYFYISDEDRYSMQFLAEIVRSAIDAGVLSFDDLFTTEEKVIGKLKQNSALHGAWDAYTNISAVSTSADNLHDHYCVKVDAKRRYIDPLALTASGPKRISRIDAASRENIESFLKMDFNQWIYTTNNM